jgi:SAM-dependent methyltransferase
MKALAAQCGGWVLVVALASSGLLLDYGNGSLWVVILVQTSGAAALTALLRCPPWWVLINFIFTPLLLLAIRLRLPPWIWLAAFAALYLIYWNSFRAQVPLFLTNRRVTAAVAGLLPPGPVRVLDLGSGAGSFVTALARLRPDARVTGIESAPLPYALSRLRLCRQPLTRIRREDFFAAPWTDYDLVYAFLSPAPMAQVWDKARREMKPGALLVSNSFAIPGREPDRIIEVDDRRHTRLLIFAL